MDIKKYSEVVSSHTLPRWNELPDFQLYMDQVLSLMQKYLEPYFIEDALTPSMINNYVKHEILPPPEKKRYSKTHLAYLVVICLMKRQLSISTIGTIIKEETKKCGIEEFYNSFVTLYQNEIKTTVDSIKEDDVQALALTLTVSASAKHAVAESAVLLAFPHTEKEKKPKKEKK